MVHRLEFWAQPQGKSSSQRKILSFKTTQTTQQLTVGVQQIWTTWPMYDICRLYREYMTYMTCLPTLVRWICPTSPSSGAPYVVIPFQWVMRRQSCASWHWEVTMTRVNHGPCMNPLSTLSQNKSLCWKLKPILRSKMALISDVLQCINVKGTFCWMHDVQCVPC